MRKSGLGAKIYNIVYSVLNFLTGSSSDSPGRKRARFVTLFLIYLLINVLLGKNLTSRHYPWYANVSMFLLLNINILLMLVLFVVLFRNLAKLMADRRKKIFGSRLQTKLVAFSVILVVVPVVTTYLMSTKLIGESINRWFDSNVANMVSTSVELSDHIRQTSTENLTAMLEVIASDLALEADDNGILDTERAMELTKNYVDKRIISGISLQSATGATYIQQNTPGVLFGFLNHNIIEKVLTGSKYSDYVIDSVRPYYWAGVPVLSGDGDVIGAVFAVNISSVSIAEDIGEIAEIYYLYKQIRYFSPPVEKAFSVLQFMVAVLIIFACIWGSMVFVRSITEPLKNLALAAQKLSKGQRDARVNITGSDELTLVSKSFNEMAEKLNQHTLELQEKNEVLNDALSQISRDKQYIDTIYRNVDSALILFDKDMNVLKVNNYAEDLIHKGSESFHDFAQKLVHDFMESGENEQIIQSVLNSGNEEAGPAGVLEETKQYIVHMNKIFDTDGSLENVLLVIDDNTHVMNLQRITLWKEVASRLTHEIKNPLTPIKLTAERVKRRSKEISEAPVRELVDNSMEMIITESDELLNLIEEFSLYARLPSLVRNDVSLLALINDTVALQSRLNSNISINVNIDGDIVIKGDNYQLKRVFINLLQNAMQAMKGEGRIYISASRSNGTVGIIVEDSGIGIPQEDISKIFVPYFSKKPSGTGLGLAIVKKIVEEHGGSITVESQPAEYTRFYINLPVK